MEGNCTQEGCDRYGRLRRGLCDRHYYQYLHAREEPRQPQRFGLETASPEVVAAWRDLYVAAGQRLLARILHTRVVDEAAGRPVESVAELAAEIADSEDTPHGEGGYPA